MIMFAFSADFACKRMSGSDKHVDLIKQEVSLFSLPEKAVLKWQGALHKAHKITYSNYYGVSSCEYYKESDIASFYTNSLQKNAWVFLQKKNEYNMAVKKNQNKYIYG